MAKKLSVGLVCMVEIRGEMFAVLQRRGEWNHEKTAPESWPGACQVTCHGKGEGEESAVEILLRELREELGEMFVSLLNDPCANGMTPYHLLNEHEDGEKKAITYGMEILDPSVLGTFRLHPSTGGIRLLSKEEVPNIRNLKRFKKTTGVRNSRITAMFPDEAEAVRRAFEHFL